MDAQDIAKRIIIVDFTNFEIIKGGNQQNNHSVGCHLFLFVFYLLSDFAVFNVASLARDIHSNANNLLTSECEWQSVVLS